MKLVCNSQMQEIENLSFKNNSSSALLMDNAGKSIAEVVKNIIETHNINTKILILVGPGNNGGDGLIAGTILFTEGYDISIYVCSPRNNQDNLLSKCIEKNIPVTSIESSNFMSKLISDLSNCDLILDAILGINANRPIVDPITKVFELIEYEHTNRLSKYDSNMSQPFVISIDIPSGMNSDNGTIYSHAVRADLTITLGFPKIGMFTENGLSHTGKIINLPIGLSKYGEHLSTEVIETEWIRSELPTREINSHKGDSGKVLVWAGSRKYIGAAYLSCMAAMRTGSGYVTLITTPKLQEILASKMTEPIYHLIPENLDGNLSYNTSYSNVTSLKSNDVTLLGPGIDQNTESRRFLMNMLEYSKTVETQLVIDADGLNILSQAENWQSSFHKPAILTPHPGEMARLMKTSIETVQSNRIYHARTAAVDWGHYIVLKGACTIIADPEGNCRIIPFANPVLASSGTGDVLAGMIASFAAKMNSPFNAATIGAYIHAVVGEIMSERIGKIGSLAGDMLPLIPSAIMKLSNKEFIHPIIIDR